MRSVVDEIGLSLELKDSMGKCAMLMRVLAGVNDTINARCEVQQLRLHIRGDHVCNFSRGAFRADLSSRNFNENNSKVQGSVRDHVIHGLQRKRIDIGAS